MSSFVDDMTCSAAQQTLDAAVNAALVQSGQSCSDLPQEDLAQFNALMNVEGCDLSICNG